MSIYAYFTCIYECMHACMYVYYMGPWYPWTQKWVSDPVTGVTDVDAITLALSCLGSYEISLDVSWCTASLNPLPCSLYQMNWKKKQGYSNN